LTFGTLLSSQGTEASFETVSPAPPGFPFVVFPPYPIPSPIHNRLFSPIDLISGAPEIVPMIGRT
ncbi:hypothetical protein, partial [Streptomyces sp. NPDC049040]|uniref:hypothetical protein n=1 Tax=Streptomyces sp. NPDC049040 TaxID=3365593 RepID=UPI00372320DF